MHHFGWYVLIKCEVRLTYMSWVNSQNAEPGFFIVTISKQASQVIVAPCKHQELRIASNIFSPGDIFFI